MYSVGLILLHSFMRPLESASKFVNLALSASLLVGGQAGCDRRDPNDIQRIESLERDLAAEKEATDGVKGKCAEVNGQLVACQSGLKTCQDSHSAEQHSKDEEAKRNESERLKKEESEKKSAEAEKEKAVITAKVNKAIEGAGIKNPTNRDLISKIFVAI